MSDLPTAVAEYCERLTVLGIEAIAVAHRAVRDYRDVLDELGIGAADCAPTLLLMVDGEPLLVISRGDRRLDLKGLKKQLRARDLRLARPEELRARTGFDPGAARSYVPGIPVLIDASLLEREFVTGGSGDFGCSVRYRARDLVKIPDSRVLACTGATGSG
jgi:prolyl-tRNA editing enzyme YbaK/EbsC (Cys-tRNA(Pro) deacylase)